MFRVLIQNYSRFFDPATKIEFAPVLDRPSGCYVGVATVDEDTAVHYDGRPGFQVLTDAEWEAVNALPVPAEREEPETGDPLADAAREQNPGDGSGEDPAAGRDLGGPPPPPESK